MKVARSSLLINAYEWQMSQCPDNTKYQILTLYVLNIYQIPHHNKYEKVLADAFMHIQPVVIWPFSVWDTAQRACDPTLHTCCYTLCMFAFTYLDINLMLNTFCLNSLS